MENARKRRKLHASTRAAKRQRIMKKKKRLTQLQVKEVREGITYQSCVASSSTADIDIDEIPGIREEPTPETIQSTQSSRVFFDIETTGLGDQAEIIQLAATYDKKTFNSYIKPNKHITREASQITNLTFRDNKLFFKGNEVPTSDTKSSFVSFIDWLPNKCVLYAHNAKRFDARFVVRLMEQLKLIQDFQRKCSGFVDTLSLIKDAYPGRKSYKQELLVKELLGSEYQAHDAMADVGALQALISACREKNVDKHSFSCSYMQKVIASADKTKELMVSLSVIPREVLSDGMKKKNASSGLNLGHLKLAFNRGGADGVRGVLSERFNGKPRVTNNKRILKAVVDYVAC